MSWPVLCPRRDFDPSEYPVALLDPNTCVHELLPHIYSGLPVRPFTNRRVRDTEIYDRYGTVNPYHHWLYFMVLGFKKE